ncbi:MAG: T9SS type A sorting domain-containing protein [Flavobacteriales bacterium]|nr:T9SS type A sorting domain-containing protein [Flavobacteriales bacterium]
MKKCIKHLLLSASTLFVSYQMTAATELYCLSYRDDPATTLVVGWEGDNGTVYYGTTDQGTNYSSYPLSHASDRTGSAHGHNRHFARLTGLTPNTMYYFVIYDAAGGTSSRFKFKTLSDDPNDPIAFVNGGDTRDGFKVFSIYTEDCPSGNCLDMRRAGNDLVAKIRPDFVAFNGDYIMNQITSDTQQEWDGWLTDWQRTISADGRMYPTMHSQGNHEDAADMYELFDIPQDEYYVLDFHGGLLRYYSLNTELDACNNTNQLNWLTNDLMLHSTGGSSDPIWKTVQYHKPTYSMANNYGLNTNQMICWVSLFENYGVSLVSESHSHTTKWTYPCVANANNDDFELDPDGIVYIGEGQWGAPHRTLDYTGANQKPYVRDQEVFDNFFYIRVSKDTIAIQCVAFQNVSSVTASTSDALGHALPSNAVTWNPSNGGVVYITDPSASVNETDKNVKGIFPNPASDVINIQFNKKTNGTLELYNSLGKLCISEYINGNSHKLNLEDACSGVNYIYIKSEDGSIESYKIVKE